MEDTPATVAARSAVLGGLFRQRALISPAAPTLEDGQRRFDGTALSQRVNRAASLPERLAMRLVPGRCVCYFS